MAFNHIEYKKPIYKIKAPLRDHLEHYGRVADISLSYDDLLRYQQLIPVTDKNGKDTNWFSALYPIGEQAYFQEELVKIYQTLIADGETLKYLKVGSIDYCSFGNSKPFRVKIINEINDNYDYFYVKKADASRIYGLELEEIFSPDKVNFIVNKSTLIEGHVVGIPVDEFIKKNKKVKIENRLRFAKEFVKFNERCFVRLLGDMRAYNFVVEIIQDFDNVQYSLRAMDFDQQSFEGRKNMYLPQFYKDNNPLVTLARELLTDEMAQQYMKQERVAMKKRYQSYKHRTKSLIRRMKKDTLSTKENIDSLKKEFAKYYNNPMFLEFKTMGQVLELHLETKLGIKIF
jgi:phosphopantetheine adenylyltransferase